MATEKQQKPSAAKVLKEFFGVREGQGLREFAGELKALSPEDKAQLVDGILDESYNY